MASLYPRKVALMSGTVPITLTTNAAGAAACMIRPYNASAFYLTYTAADYIPNTGSGTGVPTAGPTSTAAANLSFVKLTGMAVNILPLANANVNGSVYICYSETAPTIIPLTDIST